MLTDITVSHRFLRPHNLQPCSHRKPVCHNAPQAVGQGVHPLVGQMSHCQTFCRQKNSYDARGRLGLRQTLECRAAAGDLAAPEGSHKPASAQPSADPAGSMNQQQPGQQASTQPSSLMELLMRMVPDAMLNFDPRPFLEGVIRLPGQLTYPSLRELLWKGCLIMLSIMVLMVIISTFDTTFLYFVVKLMRRNS